MKKFNIFLTLVLAPVYSIYAQGLPNATFEAIVEQLVFGDPKLEAIKANGEAAVLQIKAENTLANPEVEFERLWSNESSVPNRWNISVSQSFDWPGAYGARRNAAKSQSEAEMLRYEAELFAAKNDIRILLIQLIANHKEVAILKEISTTLNSLLEKYELAWKHGETTILDLNKIRIEAVNAQIDLSEAENKHDELIVQLLSFNGESDKFDDHELLIDYPYTTLYEESQYIDAAKNSIELKCLKSATATFVAQRKVASASRFPSFSAGYVHAYEDLVHFNGLSVSVGLPIYSRKNSLASIEAQRLAANFEAINAQQNLLVNVHNKYQLAKSLKQQCDIYGNVFETTNHTTLLSKALDGGEINLLQYLQELAYFRQAQKRYISLSASYAETVTLLNSYLASN